MNISIIVPIYNEQESILPLYKQLKTVLNNRKRDYEIIFVNDGSTDRSLVNLNKIKDKHIRIIRFTRNLGLSKALSSGFKNAKGNIIVTMDGDLQNDVRDIPKLIKKLNEGYDVVCSWRYKRKDTFLSKKLPSYIFNLLVRAVFNVGIHDCSSTLRAYRKEAVKELVLSNGMHRYLPVLLAKKGRKVIEIKVMHHHRKYGKSKYKSPKRLVYGMFDLIRTKKYIRKFINQTKQ